MKAIQIREHGPPESLVVVDVPDPVPGPGEVLVRVRACALNHLDTWVRRGVPGHRFPLPIIPGSDVAGVIESGDAPGFRAGDEVLVAPFTSCGRCGPCLRGNEVACQEYRILGESRDGGCAELIAVPHASLFPKPPSLTFAEGASVLLAPLTAYHMVVTRAGVRAGEAVLVTAAAGGVGTAAVQIARSLGARVIGIVGNPSKRDAVLGLGADEVVVCPPGEDLLLAVKKTLGRTAFDVVVDSVGGPFFEAGVRLLRPFGRFVTCGATASGTASLDLRRLFFLSLSILGSTMGSRHELFEVLNLVRSGLFRPVVHAILPLRDAAEAHRLLEDRRVVGKVVLEP